MVLIHFSSVQSHMHIATTASRVTAQQPGARAHETTRHDAAPPVPLADTHLTHPTTEGREPLPSALVACGRPFLSQVIVGVGVRVAVIDEGAVIAILAASASASAAPAAASRLPVHLLGPAAHRGVGSGLGGDAGERSTGAAARRVRWWWRTCQSTLSRHRWPRRAG